MKFIAYCKDNHIDALDIASVLGVSEAEADKMLAGKVDFTLDHIYKLCTHYNISADYYFM